MIVCISSYYDFLIVIIVLNNFLIGGKLNNGKVYFVLISMISGEEIELDI